MAESEVDLCNAALALVGGPEISALTDTIPAAGLVRRLYARTRDHVLRAGAWNFATRRVSLVASVATPAYEYAYQFPLPTDPYCLRVLGTSLEPSDDTSLWRVEGRVLVTDDSAVSIRYLARVTDVGTFDSMFETALIYKLAQGIAEALSSKTSMGAAMRELYERELKEARTVDAQESSPRRAASRTLLDVR